MQRIWDLRRYGLPDALLDIWTRQQGEFLLPVQETAVQRHGLFEGRSLVISSPTSSGKTFVGEMAAMRATFAGKRVLYLTPLRALAEEKYQTFCTRYGAYGIKIAIATRDRREFDQAIGHGDFQVAVFVYEKLAQLLVRHPQLLRTIALVVVDEIQMLGDPDRGPGLELSLTKLLSSAPRPQILGLSAVLREAHDVTAWLGAELLLQEERPVELYQGVLWRDTFRYRSYNKGDEGEERLAKVNSVDPRKLLLANCKFLVEKDEQILIFLKSKRETIQCALALAKTLGLTPAQKALAALEPLEETALKAQLRLAFTGGVAFHHTDLTQDERRVVETYYRNGELRVIACTTTLAFGVNLPASTVFLEAMKWSTDPRTGAFLEVPLSWAEYENISGRAGRLGYHEQFGRAIIIATSQFQADWLWQHYLVGEHIQFTPTPGQKGVADRLLNLIAAKVCLSADELQSFFALSYTGFQQREDAAGLSLEIEQAVAALIRTQLITMGEDGRLAASTLGEATARKGIRAATAVKLARFFTAAGDRAVADLELLYVLALTKDGSRLPLPLSTTEHRGRVYTRQLRARLEKNGCEVGEDLRYVLRAKMVPTVQRERAAKLALLLTEWIEGEELTALEQRYQCYAGTIKAQTEELAWLSESAAEIAQVIGWTLPSRLSELAECLRFGVSPAGLALARARLPGITRDIITALVGAGVTSPATFVELPREEIRRYLSPSEHDQAVSASP